MPKIYTALTYKSVFDDYDTTSPNELLKGIPMITALKYICYTCTQLHIKETNWTIQEKLLQLWMKNCPDVERVKIKQTIERIHQPSIFDNITSLFVIEDIFEHCENIQDRVLAGIEELALFKVFLWEAQRWTDTQKINPVKDINGYVAFALPLMLPFVEHYGYKDFRCQLIKAIYFFQACEKDAIFSGFLNIFLSEYNLKTWQEYLIRILSIYIRPMKEMEIPSILVFSENNILAINFLEFFCIDLNKYKRQGDFLELRETPVFRIQAYQYLFLNLNFMIDKLFQGIQFDFYRILLKHKVLYKEKVFKSFGDFKSVYGSLVSESGLFYRVMEECFCRSSYIRKNGDEMKAIAGKGYSDYYMRDKNKVYLFEYKDVLFSSPVKSSNNIEMIEQELKMKFVRDNKGADEGVSQLANNIKMFREGRYKQVDDDSSCEAIIYPILLYTDEAFSVPGVNYLLRKYFRNELKDRGFENDFNIKDVIMLHIDDFILYQDLFREKKLKLNHCLNNYISSYYGIVHPLEQIEGLESLSKCILEEVAKLKYTGHPKILDNEIPQMIPLL